MTGLWLLVSVVVLLEGRCVVGVDEEIVDLAKKIISNVNEDLRLKSIKEISLPDSSYDYLLLSGDRRNARVGDFTTLGVVGEKQIITRNDSSPTETLFDFALTLGIEDFHLTYDSSVSLFRLFSFRSRVSAKENIFSLAGQVTAYPSGSCQAVLHSAVLTRLGAYDVTTLDSNLFQSMFNYVFRFLLKFLVHFEVNYFNSAVSNEIQTESFKTSFSDVACHSLGY